MTKKTGPFYESMTTVATINNTVRVWRTETELCDQYDNRDIIALCTDRLQGVVNKKDLAEEIVWKCPRVSAVEVKDDLGMGLVLYVDW